MVEGARNGQKGERWTIKRMLSWSEGFLAERGSTSPRLDAELLLAEVLSVGRLQLYLDFDRPLIASELAAFKELIKRRARHEPVAYILGRKAFHAIELKVGPDVLVPRPETEWLVDQVLGFLAAEGAAEGPILDLCTGSGAVALAVAHGLRERGDARHIVASDVSEAALRCARENARILGLEAGIEWLHGDLFAATAGRGPFAVIASNPPYVRSRVMPTLAPDVRDWEPALALDGGAEGLDILWRIAAQAPGHLQAGGLVTLELGSQAQGESIAAALTEAGLRDAAYRAIGPGPTGIVSARAPAAGQVAA